MDLKKDILQQAANEARGLAIDAIHKSSSGHLGLPLGCAEIGAVLFGGGGLDFNPFNPRWVNRDRFILSAGHGSMFLYSWLHMAGYDVSLDDVKAFRSLHSKTPGHPEFGETPGVESTTGPLGQGVGNAVGMALSGKMLQARFNSEDNQPFNYHVVCLAGDGCLQEGVAREAVAFAGHQGLDNLILIYDSNEVTLDAQAEASQSEDVAALYTALGWDVQTIDGHDMDAISSALNNAKSGKDGKPHLIIAKTEIGRGISEVAGTWKAHGEGGAKFAAAARSSLGLPEETFYLSEQTLAHFQEVARAGKAKNTAWDATFDTWKTANPEAAAIIEAGYAKARPSADELFAVIPEFDPEKAVATRAAGGSAMTALVDKLPLMVSGSADLHGSTKNYLKGAGDDFTRENQAGRNIRFGIREHAMGAIVNGMGYEGLFLASGATFFTFSDYMRPSVRLSALAKLPVMWYWTHDSVGVGEDGPTHQPVEHVSACRAIPGLDMIRPGDVEETAGAIVAAMMKTDGPTGLVLSRQNLPVLSQIPVSIRREGVLKGGYVAIKETGDLDTIILSCGSELHIAIAAAEKLGDGIRVVSMPSMEIFERQSEEYKEEVLPPSIRKRIAVEAGVGQSWYKYIGLDGVMVGVEQFGLSAPGGQIYEALGLTPDKVVEAVQGL